MGYDQVGDVPDYPAVFLSDQLKDTTGVEIEFEPEPLGDMPLRHMMCNIPGGIRVEFLAPNA